MADKKKVKDKVKDKFTARPAIMQITGKNRQQKAAPLPRSTGKNGRMELQASQKKRPTTTARKQPRQQKARRRA